MKSRESKMPVEDIFKTETEIRKQADYIFSLENIYRQLDFLFTSSDDFDKKNIKENLRHFCVDILLLFKLSYLPVFEVLLKKETVMFDKYDKEHVKLLKKIESDYKNWIKEDLEKLLEKLISLSKKIDEAVDSDFDISSPLVKEYIDNRSNNDNEEIKKKIDGVFTFDMLKGYSKEEIKEMIKEKTEELKSMLGHDSNNFVSRENINFFRQTLERKIMEMEGALKLLEVL